MRQSVSSMIYYIHWRFERFVISTQINDNKTTIIAPCLSDDCGNWSEHELRILKHFPFHQKRLLHLQFTMMNEEDHHHQLSQERKILKDLFYFAKSEKVT